MATPPSRKSSSFIPKYFKNLFGSLGRITSEVLDETIPIIKETREANPDLDFKKYLKEGKGAIKDMLVLGPVAGALKDFTKNVAKSLATGNLWDEEREMKAMSGMMKGMMGFDLEEMQKEFAADFGDDFADEFKDSSDTKTESFEEDENGSLKNVTNNVLNRNVKNFNVFNGGIGAAKPIFEATKSINRTNTNLSRESMTTFFKLTAANELSAIKRHSQTMSSLNDANGNLVNVLKVERDLNDKFTTFSKQNIALLQDVQALLREQTEMQKSLYKSQQEEGSGYSMFNTENKFSSVNENGIINIQKFLDLHLTSDRLIKSLSVFNEDIGEMVLSLKDMMSLMAGMTGDENASFSIMVEMILKQVTANPVKLVVSTYLRNLIGSQAKTMFADFSEFLKNNMRPVLRRMAELGESGAVQNKFLKGLFRFFGESGDRERLTGQRLTLEKRTVPFDSYVRASIVNVIPGFLSKILYNTELMRRELVSKERELELQKSGTQELFVDYKKGGAFFSKGKVEKDAVEDIRRELNFKSWDIKDALNDYFRDHFKTIAKQNGKEFDASKANETIQPLIESFVTLMAGMASNNEKIDNRFFNRELLKKRTQGIMPEQYSDLLIDALIEINTRDTRNNKRGQTLSKLNRILEEIRTYEIEKSKEMVGIDKPLSQTFLREGTYENINVKPLEMLLGKTKNEVESSSGKTVLQSVVPGFLKRGKASSDAEVIKVYREIEKIVEEEKSSNRTEANKIKNIESKAKKLIYTKLGYSHQGIRALQYLEGLKGTDFNAFQSSSNKYTFSPYGVSDAQYNLSPELAGGNTGFFTRFFNAIQNPGDTLKNFLNGPVAGTLDEMRKSIDHFLYGNDIGIRNETEGLVKFFDNFLETVRKNFNGDKDSFIGKTRGWLSGKKDEAISKLVGKKDEKTGRRDSSGLIDLNKVDEYVSETVSKYVGGPLKEIKTSLIGEKKYGLNGETIEETVGEVQKATSAIKDNVKLLFGGKTPKEAADNREKVKNKFFSWINNLFTRGKFLSVGTGALLGSLLIPGGGIFTGVLGGLIGSTATAAEDIQKTTEGVIGKPEERNKFFTALDKFKDRFAGLNFQQAFGRYFLGKVAGFGIGTLLGGNGALGAAIGGALGGFAGLANISQDFKTKLFGEDGFLNPQRVAGLKKAFSTGSLTFALAKMGSGFGLMGTAAGALMGFVLGQKDEFHNFLWGKKNVSGATRNGIFTNIVDKFNDTFKSIKTPFYSLIETLRYSFLTNIIYPYKKLAYIGFLAGRSVYERFKESKFFKSILDKFSPIVNFATNTVFAGIRGVFNKFTGGLANLGIKGATWWQYGIPEYLAGFLGKKLFTGQANEDYENFKTNEGKIKAAEKEKHNKRMELIRKGKYEEHLAAIEEEHLKEERERKELLKQQLTESKTIRELLEERFGKKEAEKLGKKDSFNRELAKEILENKDILHNSDTVLGLLRDSGKKGDYSLHKQLLDTGFLGSREALLMERSSNKTYNALVNDLKAVNQVEELKNAHVKFSKYSDYFNANEVNFEKLINPEGIDYKQKGAKSRLEEVFRTNLEYPFEEYTKIFNESKLIPENHEQKQIYLRFKKHFENKKKLFKKILEEKEAQQTNAKGRGFPRGILSGIKNIGKFAGKSLYSATLAKPINKITSFGSKIRDIWQSKDDSSSNISENGGEIAENTKDTKVTLSKLLSRASSFFNKAEDYFKGKPSKNSKGYSNLFQPKGFVDLLRGNDSLQMRNEAKEEAREKKFDIIIEYLKGIYGNSSGNNDRQNKDKNGGFFRNMLGMLTALPGMAGSAMSSIFGGVMGMASAHPYVLASLLAAGAGYWLYTKYEDYKQGKIAEGAKELEKQKEKEKNRTGKMVFNTSTKDGIFTDSNVSSVINDLLKRSESKDFKIGQKELQLVESQLGADKYQELLTEKLKNGQLFGTNLENARKFISESALSKNKNFQQSLIYRYINADEEERKRLNLVLRAKYNLYETSNDETDVYEQDRVQAANKRLEDFIIDRDTLASKVQSNGKLSEDEIKEVRKYREDLRSILQENIVLGSGTSIKKLNADNGTFFNLLRASGWQFDKNKNIFDITENKDQIIYFPFGGDRQGQRVLIGRNKLIEILESIKDKDENLKLVIEKGKKSGEINGDYIYNFLENLDLKDKDEANKVYESLLKHDLFKEFNNDNNFSPKGRSKKQLLNPGRESQISYSNVPFGDSTLGDAGCSIFAAKSGMDALGGNSPSILDMSSRITKIPGEENGASIPSVVNALRNYGYSATSSNSPYSISDIKSSLQSGKAISITEPNDDGKTSHAISLKGLTSNGNVISDNPLNPHGETIEPLSNYSDNLGGITIAKGPSLLKRIPRGDLSSTLDDTKDVNKKDAKIEDNREKEKNSIINSFGDFFKNLFEKLKSISTSKNGILPSLIDKRLANSVNDPDAIKAGEVNFVDADNMIAEVKKYYDTSNKHIKDAKLKAVNPVLLSHMVQYGELYKKRYPKRGKIRINSTYRTKAEQKALSGNKGAAKSGRSPHNFGLGVDITSSAFEGNEDLLRASGLVRPLLNWSKVREPWHVEAIEYSSDSLSQRNGGVGLIKRAQKMGLAPMKAAEDEADFVRMMNSGAFNMYYNKKTGTASNGAKTPKGVTNSLFSGNMSISDAMSTLNQVWEKISSIFTGNKFGSEGGGNTGEGSGENGIGELLANEEAIKNKLLPYYKNRKDGNNKVIPPSILFAHSLLKTNEGKDFDPKTNNLFGVIDSKTNQLKRYPDLEESIKDYSEKYFDTDKPFSFANPVSLGNTVSLAAYSGILNASDNQLIKDIGIKYTDYAKNKTYESIIKELEKNGEKQENPSPAAKGPSINSPKLINTQQSEISKKLDSIDKEISNNKTVNEVKIPDTINAKLTEVPEINVNNDNSSILSALNDIKVLLVKLVEKEFTIQQNVISDEKIDNRNNSFRNNPLLGKLINGDDNGVISKLSNLHSLVKGIVA